MMNREKLLEWLEQNDHFAISCGENDESSTSRLRRMVEVVKEIDSSVISAATMIRKAGRRWGVGDSATDEAIADRLFQVLHWR